MADTSDALSRYLNNINSGYGFAPPDAVVGNSQYGGQFTGLANGIQSTPPPGSDNGGTSKPSIDYSNLFTFFGLPSDMVSTINQMMAQYISSGISTEDATTSILGYIRGTDWYKKTYPGIAFGLSTGLFDESQDMEVQYRRYINEADQYYQQYLGRNITTDEVVNALKAGTQVSILGKRLEGQSFANAYGKEWDSTLGAFGNGPLTADQKLALGEYETGYKTTLGDQLDRQLQQAQARMKRIFQGALASPADLQKGQTLKAPSLAAQSTPDVGAL